MTTKRKVARKKSPTSAKLTAVNARKLVLEDRSDRIITGRMVEWLDRNSRIPLDESDIPLIHALLFDKSADIRTSRFGASSRGSCERKQVFIYLGAPASNNAIDYRLANIFIDGQWRHIRWQLMMLKAGIIDKVEVKHEIPELRLGVSIDGENTKEGFFVEIKGDGTFKDVTAPSEAHMMQIHTYFFASGLDKCVYFIEQKRSQEWYEYVVRPTTKYMKMVENELKRLNKAIETQTLPEPLHECKERRGEYRSCPFRQTCLSATWETITGTAQEVTLRNPTVERRLLKKRP